MDGKYSRAAEADVVPNGDGKHTWWTNKGGNREGSAMPSNKILCMQYAGPISKD